MESRPIRSREASHALTTSSRLVFHGSAAMQNIFTQIQAARVDLAPYHLAPRGQCKLLTQFQAEAERHYTAQAQGSALSVLFSLGALGGIKHVLGGTLSAVKGVVVNPLDLRGNLAGLSSSLFTGTATVLEAGASVASGVTGERPAPCHPKPLRRF